MAAERSSKSSKSFILATKTIVFSASSLLGPSKCIKCIVDNDGNFELTSSTLKLLQVIKVDHPAISIVHDACKGLHHAFGTGCSTLVFMIGSWLQSLELLIDQGIPIPIINRLFDEAVGICVKEAELASRSLNNLSTQVNDRGVVPEIAIGPKCISFEPSVMERQRNTDRMEGNLLGNMNLKRSSTTFNSDSTSATATRSFMPGKSNYGLKNRYSRHLVEDDAALVEQQQNNALSYAVKRLCIGIARQNETVSNLLLNIMEILKRRMPKPKYLCNLEMSLDKVFIESLEGKSEVESFVFEGICVSASHEDLGPGFTSLQNKPINICLINFDLTLYCKQSNSQNATNRENSWKQKLFQLQVACIIYHGDNKGFIEICQSAGVLVMKASTAKHLKAISVATANPIVPSIHDLEVCDIGMQITLSLIGNIKESLRQRKEKKNLQYLISLGFPNATETYTTVVLCGTTPNITLLLEERFSSCLHKLNNILRKKKYVPGSGFIEKRCIRKLKEYSDKRQADISSQRNQQSPRFMEQEANLYRQMVFTEVSKGLERFNSKINQNIDEVEADDASIRSIDDLSSKCEALKRAMSMVNVISRIDMIVTSDVKQWEQNFR